MINKLFGKWTVKSLGRVEGNRQYYLCECVCGKKQEVAEQNLSRGRSTQCRSCAGRSRHGITVSEPVIKVGKHYGSWTVLSESDPVRQRRHYLCKCSCGVESIVSGYTLHSGKSLQCEQCGSRWRMLRQENPDRVRFDMECTECASRVILHYVPEKCPVCENNFDSA